MVIAAVDRTALETKVKSMYSDVAANPHGEFHFEMGRPMAERLGYTPADLDRIPQDAIDSFAGVGHFFHLANLQPGEAVVDLGSGSGMDSFIAALKVGSAGRVVGIDMTDAQLAKASRLAQAHGVRTITYRAAIESAGFQVERVEENSGYRFISNRAQKATAKWGVKSVSILARRV